MMNQMIVWPDVKVLQLFDKYHLEILTMLNHGNYLSGKLHTMDSAMDIFAALILELMSKQNKENKNDESQSLAIISKKITMWLKRKFEAVKGMTNNSSSDNNGNNNNNSSTNKNSSNKTGIPNQQVDMVVFGNLLNGVNYI